MKEIRIEESHDAWRDFPYKVFDKRGCTWHLAHYNCFTVGEEYLTGGIGNFREGGNIEPRKIEDVIEWDFCELDGNSVFNYVSDQNIVEWVKEEILDYIKHKTGMKNMCGS